MASSYSPTRNTATRSLELKTPSRLASPAEVPSTFWINSSMSCRSTLPSVFRSKELSESSSRMARQSRSMSWASIWPSELKSACLEVSLRYQFTRPKSNDPASRSSRPSLSKSAAKIALISRTSSIASPAEKLPWPSRFSYHFKADSAFGTIDPATMSRSPSLSKSASSTDS